jgi:4'-phosphopantetheinyl transferase
MAEPADYRQRCAVLRFSSTGWDLAGDEIHLWSATLDREPEVLATLEETLSPEEKARADRFHFARDRHHFVVARGLLRELLGKYLHQPAADIQFSYGQYGKPSLSARNVPGGACFNLSHSSGLVLFAIAREGNLGLDVEHVRPDFAGEDIARRYFSEREVSELLSLPPESRDAGFFNCWTRKEAYIKARGLGLQIPLDSFSVSLSPGAAAQFLSGVEPRWHLAAHHPADGYVAAVAYDGAAASFKYFYVDS